MSKTTDETTGAAEIAKLVIELDDRRSAPVSEAPHFAALVAVGLAEIDEIGGGQAYVLSEAGVDEWQRIRRGARRAS